MHLSGKLVNGFLSNFVYALILIKSSKDNCMLFFVFLFIGLWPFIDVTILFLFNIL